MAKGAYFGVGSTAKKIKKMYIGIGGIARKVKRAYIGIAGKARLWFSGNPVYFYGGKTPLSVYDTRSYSHFEACSTDKYCYFVGAASKDGYINAFTKALSKSLITSYGIERNPSCGRVGDNVVIVGGTWGNSDGSNDTAFSVDDSLTLKSLSSFAYRISVSAPENAGDYLLFGGITQGHNRTSKPYVYAYDNSLTRTTIDSLSDPGGSWSHGNIGGYAIFLTYDQYENPTPSNKTLNIYSSSLTRTISTQTITGKSEAANMNWNGQNATWFPGIEGGNYSFYVNPRLTTAYVENPLKPTVPPSSTAPTESSVGDKSPIGAYVSGLYFVSERRGSEYYFNEELKKWTWKNVARYKVFDESFTRMPDLDFSNLIYRNATGPAVCAFGDMLVQGGGSGSNSQIDEFASNCIYFKVE